MMKKIYGGISLLLFQIILAQTKPVGINITNTSADLINAQLGIRSNDNTINTNAFRATNSDGVNLMTTTNNGFVGIGTDKPQAALDILGESTPDLPSFIIRTGLTNVTTTLYTGAHNATLKFYSTQSSQFANPSNIAKQALIFTNDDDDKTTYTNGLFIGTHAAGTPTGGIIIDENGNAGISLFRDRRPLNKLDIGGSIRIKDEGFGFVAGTSCANPGQISFNSTNGDFLGCVETVTGNLWKKLNN